MVLSGLKISSLVSLGQLCNDGCIIGLDSTELVVVKNSNIVLKGTRNLKDGLWDIPLYKSTIQSFNHPTPKTHAGMYMARHVLPPTAHKVRTPPRNNQPRELSAFHVAKIQTEILDKLISQKSKRDATRELHRVDLNDCHHKLTVIVRKQQTRQELVQYLHATCISPIKSTYVRVIKRNNFLTWPGLTEDLVKRHLPPNIPTAQGHLHREMMKL